MFLLIAFCVTFLIQTYFYLFLFRKYTSYKHSESKPSVFQVSIVVCAKNEADNLKVLLPSLARQEFSNYEIIVVDDGSSDSTLSEILSFKQSYQDSNFEIEAIHISQKKSKGKKLALTKGIMAARYDHILLTDADCNPVSRKWIDKMTAPFTEKSSVVLGYGAYDKIGGSVLNKLIRFETLLTAVQYFSYALDGKAYMGVGRNMAYKKKTFLEAGGFADHLDVKSGDDDLFVSQVAKGENVAICDDMDSFTISRPQKKLFDWIRQKRRHITTSGHYNMKTKFSLGLFYMSQLTFYALAFLAVLLNTYLFVIIPLFFIRFLFWYITLNKAAARLNEKDLIALGPLYEISIIFMQLYIFLKNIISPPKYW